MAEYNDNKPKQPWYVSPPPRLSCSLKRSDLPKWIKDNQAAESFASRTAAQRQVAAFYKIAEESEGLVNLISSETQRILQEAGYDVLPPERFPRIPMKADNKVFKLVMNLLELSRQEVSYTADPARCVILENIATELNIPKKIKHASLPKWLAHNIAKKKGQEPI